MKWKLTADDAVAIAVKLGAERIIGSKAHEKVHFRHNGKLILTFGIRRGSGEKGHNFIPGLLHLSGKDCRTFRECSMSLETYIQRLKTMGLIRD
jgi:hypothetical protein